MAHEVQQERDPFGKADTGTPWKKIVALLVLLALLVAALYSVYYYNAHRRLPVPGIMRTGDDIVAPPQYLYSISGPQGSPDALAEPWGVSVSADDLVYVTDGVANVVRVYNVDGDYQFTISAIDDGERAELGTPVYVQVNTLGEVHVSDRRHRAIYVFTADGDYLRKVVPADPEEAAVWGPLAMTFDEDGNLWVTDVGRTDIHQVIAFDPQGNEIRRFGRQASVEQVTDSPGLFDFPNGIHVREGMVYVADSNNRRIQVFTTDGQFEYFIRTSGTPRGIDMDGEARLYVADALAHQADVYRATGERIAGFGAPGVGPGQFRYTNDLALDQRTRIFLTDRANHQVQVWGWPEPIPVIPPVPETPSQWALCLSPLLLLPLLLLLRRRRFVVTDDFLEEMAAADLISEMAEKKRWKWIVPAEEFSRYEGRVLGGVALEELLTPEQHSESDARDLMDRIGVEHRAAVLLVVAKRAKTLCTQHRGLAVAGRALGIDVYDARLFAERFLSERKGGS